MEPTDFESALRILIVDDYADQADSLANVLIHRGYTVQVAYSPGAALEQASLYKPDVVLVDLGLPKMDGYELTTRLRHMLPGATFVAVTGHAGEAYQSKARAFGIEYYFVKPVPIAKLREVLELVAAR
jgi:CheY-like chemotaxis protein